MKSHPKKFVYMITGASGVGKSTLAEQLKLKYGNKENIAILGFDTIGVPSVEEMTKRYGSPSEWQRVTIKEWVAKILHEVAEPLVILEGQVNFDFIYEAFEYYNFKEFKVILIDCNEEEMVRRLEHNRGQPELANESMRKWRVYLRRQAEERNAPVINTDRISAETVLTKLEEILGADLN